MLASAGYSDIHLENAAAVSLVEDQLLLEQRVEGAPRRARLGLGQALLAADQVDLHPGRGQHLGAGLALGGEESDGGITLLSSVSHLQPPRPDDLHLQVAALVHEAQLDVAEDGGAEDLGQSEVSTRSRDLVSANPSSPGDPRAGRGRGRR